MQLLSIALLRQAAQPHSDAVILHQASELSSFGYFQRSGAGQFLAFTARTVGGRVPVGSRNSVTHEGHYAHVRCVQAGGGA
jgi:synaptobrevin family protein YKT6